MKKIIAAIMTLLAAAVILTVTAAAESSAAAPARIWSKIINHDKVSIRWDAVSGADGYVLYRLDPETKAYTKVTGLAKPRCTFTGLDPFTRYTYAVTAIKKTGDDIIESNKRKVTFTTPEEWFYTCGNSGFVDVDDPAYDSRNIYRHHYDGSGLEKFDFFPLIPEDWLFDSTEDSYYVCNVVQDMGYVYVYYEYTEVLDDVWIDVYRFRNDGTGLERTNLGGSSPDHKLFFDEDTGFMGYDSYVNGGGELLYVTDAIVCKTVADDESGILSAVKMFGKEKSVLSNFAEDGKYLYYFTTPYRGPTYDEDDEDDTAQQDNTAYIWRTSLDKPAELTRTKYGYLESPKQEEVTECIGKIKYSYSGEAVYTVGVKNGYLYYVIEEKKNSDDKYTYGFYRIPTSGKKVKPERMFGMKLETLADVRINTNYMYILGDRKGYRVSLSGKIFRPKKFYTLDDGNFGWSFRTLDSSQVEIVNSYMYIHGRFGSSYYRLKLSGAELRKSSRPYLWK